MNDDLDPIEPIEPVVVVNDDDLPRTITEEVLTERLQSIRDDLPSTEDLQRIHQEVESRTEHLSDLLEDLEKRITERLASIEASLAETISRVEEMVMRVNAIGEEVEAWKDSLTASSSPSTETITATPEEMRIEVPETTAPEKKRKRGLW